MKSMLHINRIEIQGKTGCSRISQVQETKVINFSVMTETFEKTSDGCTYCETTWHNVVAWNSDKIDQRIFTAEKGTPVNVIGRIRTQRYTAADDTERIYNEIVASSVKVIGQ